MNDLDRWVDLEGPPPPGLRELLDVLAPPVSPELVEELDRRVYAAVAAEDRRRARTHTLKWIVALAAAAAFLASCSGVAAVAYRHRATLDVRAVHHVDLTTHAADMAADGGALE